MGGIVAYRAFVVSATNPATRGKSTMDTTVFFIRWTQRQTRPHGAVARRARLVLSSLIAVPNQTQPFEESPSGTRPSRAVAAAVDDKLKHVQSAERKTPSAWVCA